MILSQPTASPAPSGDVPPSIPIAARGAGPAPAAALPPSQRAERRADSFRIVFNHKLFWLILTKV